MSSARRLPPPLWAILVVLALAPGPAAAAPSCGPAADVTRHLRQLYLDLLGRPPTVAEYEAAQAKGEVREEDLRELMAREEFYGRMRLYHRALFRSNISASIADNRDTLLQNNGTIGAPYEVRGNPAAVLRGRNGQGCDRFIRQAECATRTEDPHREPASRACYDAFGVPLPVSSDYNPVFYECTRLDSADPSIATCADAVAKGALPARHLRFCDMRRLTPGAAVPRPHLCLPNPANPSTAANTLEVLDAASGEVVAFAHPSGTTPRLDFCTVRLQLDGGLKGSYETQYGCIQREGYELAPPPYFEVTGATEVAICAIEAQAREVNPWTLRSCEGRGFIRDRTCGCGEAMRRCEGFRTHEARVAAFNAEPELIADSVLRRDEPYFQILTTRRSFVNGTLSAFFRYRQGAGVWDVSPPSAPDAIPVIEFADADTWKEIVRDEQHSGVLTTTSYLLRFPTYRARVNEFYEALLCKAFVAPAGESLPAPGDACNRENNLAQRCGCNYCHATLEPAGAHWGRYGERSAVWLDPELYPRFDPVCRDCALAGNTQCGGECAQYVMQALDNESAESLGMLKTYLYRTPDEEQNIEVGPRLLVERMLQTGDLERCAVKRVWQEFLGRPMSGAEQALYLDDMALEFASGGHRLKQLVLRVLQSDAYRRID